MVDPEHAAADRCEEPRPHPPHETAHVVSPYFRRCTGAGDLTRTDRVVSEVRLERARQLARWGEQIIGDIEPGDDGADLFDGLSYDVLTYTVRARNDSRPPDERYMIPVLLEEVLEACEARAAGDVTAYRAELIQVAALALKAVELVDIRLEMDPEAGP